MLIINVYFNRIIPAILVIASLLIIHFEDHPHVRAFIHNIRLNNSFLLYHYKGEFILNTIYVFTRVNYIFAPFFFIFCEGFSFLSENSAGYAALIFFSVLLDFCTSLYISKYRNFSSEFKYVFMEMAPRAIAALAAAYIPYANTNPTHGISHMWHRHGPRYFGAHGAVAYSHLQVTTIDHLHAVHQYESLHQYLDHNGVPNTSLILYRIHSDPEMYLRWRNHIPLSEWSRYGLDKPIGEVFTREMLDDLKINGFVEKTATLEELQRTIRRVE